MATKFLRSMAREFSQILPALQPYRPSLGFGVCGFAILCVLAQPWVGVLGAPGEVFNAHTVAALNASMDWFIAHTAPFFRAISWLLAHPMKWVQQLLQWLPWSVVVAIFTLLAYRAGSVRLAVFAALSFVYILAIGLWSESMNSLALVCVSVPLSVALGFGVGVLGYRSERAEKIIQPLLDITQTIPAFAYLIPILLLFGFGPVVGLIASIIFAFPPMVRNTMVGLRQVPDSIIEAGEMAGASPRQLFWRVRFPAALPQLLLGVNQTTMAALSMIIIASIIGASADIGWTVLTTMRKAVFGESLLAGVVIALLAMNLDRITRGLSLARNQYGKGHKKFYLGSALGIATLLVVAQFVPPLRVWQPSWVLDFAAPLNHAMDWFILEAKPYLNGIKLGFVFYLMLPLKIGLKDAITPFSWGFALTAWHILVYAALVAAGAGYCFAKNKKRLGLVVLSAGLLFYSGFTNIPWLALSALLLYAAYRIGGRGLVIGTALTLALVLLTGIWDKVMLSLYLCSIAVLLAFLLGTTLGIVAADNTRFSNFMKPINDTLQTMPPFVLLIPILMIFKIGEFTAMLAIISYAYVPAFKYTEHGLRSVSATVVEAATCMGCTPRQLLFSVRIPLAMPNIMLGLNQCIMYGIAMLVIAALVGTNGLGQQIYVGLSKADFGIGILAGVGMACIAMLAERFCRAWQRQSQTPSIT